MKLLSIVVPVLNESETIETFVREIQKIIPFSEINHEIIFVDDGSTDGTAELVESLHSNDPRLKLVKLTRNFGKEAALTAGLEASTGDAVIPMDVDLQDPPELILEFLKLWHEGYQVVYGKRVARNLDTPTKRVTAGLFYKIFNSIASFKIEENVGDYRLMDRRVVDDTLLLRERNRFMKGIFAWVGYRSIGVPYERPDRQEGVSKFNYWKLWNFALDGLTGFSTLPLRVWTYVGAAIGAGALLYMTILVGKTLIFGVEVPGYASIMAAILFFGAVQLISLGIIGEYLGRLYVESKQRPLYLAERKVGALRRDDLDRQVK